MADAWDTQRKLVQEVEEERQRKLAEAKKNGEPISPGAERPANPVIDAMQRRDLRDSMDTIRRG